MLRMTHVGVDVALVSRICASHYVVACATRTPVTLPHHKSPEPRNPEGHCYRCSVMDEVRCKANDDCKWSDGDCAETS